jgi:cytoskeletal protein RodZ
LNRGQYGSQIISYEDDSQQSNNRLFIIVAVALVGLICFGALGVGGWLTIVRTQQAQEQAVANESQPQEPTAPTAIPTETVTPLPTSTNTPLPTPTATLVVPNQQDIVPAADESQPSLPTAAPPISDEEVTPTNTLVVNRDNQATPAGPDESSETNTTAPEEMPQGGGVVNPSNSYLGWAGVMVLGLIILGLVSRLTSSSWKLH